MGFKDKLNISKFQETKHILMRNNKKQLWFTNTLFTERSAGEGFFTDDQPDCFFFPVNGFRTG